MSRTNAAMLFAVTLSISSVAAAEPKSPASDDKESLVQLNKIQIILRRNEHGNVKTAICAGCKLRKPTQDDLVHFKGLPSLESIILQTIRDLNDDGLAHLSELTSITSLKLPRNHDITGAGIKHFAKLRQLKTLNLGYSHLTEADLQRLSRLLPNTTIMNRNTTLPKEE